MGRAFVGLADEATAAYNNPAGLTVLAAPEFSLEYRSSSTQFDFLQQNDSFDLISGAAQSTRIDSDKLAFASLSFGMFDMAWSVFYVNHLDYQRSTKDEEQTRWVSRTRGYEFNYINQHDVSMSIDTYGLSFSKRWGRLSLGGAVGLSRLSVDYDYLTRLSSDFFSLNEIVQSEALAQSQKVTLAFGSLWEVTDKSKVGLVYKRQPAFRFDERVNNPQHPPDEFPDGQRFGITFKVPDSVNLGFSLQPNDLMTILLDFDWIRYSQLTGQDFTIISAERFNPDDYRSPDVFEVHLGLEYLIPVESGIVALRSGMFLDPDHKTRFIGPTDDEVGEIQDFIFNFGRGDDNVGYTAGLGFVWKNKVQLDLAVVRSDRFDWLVTSFLYRF